MRKKLKGLGPVLFLVFSMMLGSVSSMGLCEDVTITLTPETVVEDVTCFGMDDGEITLAVTGGASPYTFQWSGGLGTSGDLTGVAAGNYVLTITDANGCKSDNIFVKVGGPTAALEVAIDTLIHADCGENNGSIKVQASGGTVVNEEGYDYSWNNNKTSPEITGLQPGTYTVTVNDDNNCEVMLPVEVEETGGVSGSISVQPIPCQDGGQGTLTATPEGGSGNYSYMWSAGSSTERSASFMEMGTYSVTVTDSDSGCKIPLSGELDFADAPLITNATELDTAFFQDRVTQTLAYSLNSTNAGVVWEIMSTTNINISGTTPYKPTGGSDNGNISLTFELTDNTLPGEVVLRVTPVGGLCTGEFVETVINVTTGGPVPCQVTASEILAPNGSNNNTWRVSFPGDDPQNYAVKIFSRGGQMVYETNSMATAWTGEDCPDGPYYYIIVNKKDGSECRGAVSILR